MLVEGLSLSNSPFSDTPFSICKTGICFKELMTSTKPTLAIIAVESSHTLHSIFAASQLKTAISWPVELFINNDICSTLKFNANRNMVPLVANWTEETGWNFVASQISFMTSSETTPEN
uniref:Uncharacterized protein n=1 Tax=Opuntia streptacantha TaxID=393608 RepID=A0A7C8YUQ1_OPUST